MTVETYRWGVRKDRDGEYRLIFEGCWIGHTPKRERIANDHDGFCVECGEYSRLGFGEYTVIKEPRTIFGIPLGSKTSGVVFECADCLGAELGVKK